MYVKRIAGVVGETPFGRLLAGGRSAEDAALEAARQFDLSPLELLAMVWLLRRIANGDRS